MNPELAALLGVVAALTVGVVSPGPSFIMVARTAVATSRTKALGAALGMGVGGALFGAAALLGLQAVFQAVPWLYVVLKVVGGTYLCYLGYLMFRHATQPLDVGEDATVEAGTRHTFWLGLTTQLSNPKTAIVYASVFAALLPPGYGAGFAVALLVAVFCVESGSYALVAIALSAGTPRRFYLAYKAWLDRIAGSTMAVLGLKLITGAARQ